MKILITGTAGFIGSHLVNRLIKNPGHEITGIDIINEYNDINLKYDRLKECGIYKDDVSFKDFAYSRQYNNYKFLRADIANFEILNKIFKQEQFDVVINLAAQAGVRYSLENPQAYVHSNLVGFTNILECCRHYKIKHLLYASSSSVYGTNNEPPFSENANVDCPASFYAATKKSNELMAYAYSHLYQLPTTGLRFFTVYGPFGRTDMAPFIFTEAIFNEKPVSVFNNGDMLRDFTYIDDVVESLVRLIDKSSKRKSSEHLYQIFNVGNSQPVKLIDFIHTLEKNIGKKAIIDMQPIQPGDIRITCADNSKLEKSINYKPTVSPETGLAKFIDWYKSYYGI